jgi:putative membrane protein
MNDKPSAPPVDLALVRTDLANERTLLAYGRTALIVAGTGVSLIKFIGTSALLQGLGWFLVAVGIVIGLIGVVRFTRLHHRLHAKHPHE